MCVVFDNDRGTMLIIPLQTREMHGVVCLITDTCYARDLFTRTSVAAETARWQVKLTFYTVVMDSMIGRSVWALRYNDTMSGDVSISKLSCFQPS